MKEDDFEDLLSTQGFASKNDRKGPRTIAEMRRQEMTREMDPLKLQVNEKMKKKKESKHVQHNVQSVIRLVFSTTADPGLDRGKGAEHQSSALDSAHSAVGGRDSLEARGHG